jgi:hypothetical protein
VSFVVHLAWPVVSGQLKRQFFSWANFENCTFFWIRMFRFGWLLVGFFVDAGESRGAGKGFLLNRIANLHDFLG